MVMGEFLGERYPAHSRGSVRAKRPVPPQRLAALVLGALALVCLGCGAKGDRDRVRRLAPTVWAGSPATNPPALNHNNWQDLKTGDAVGTDASGEAELELAGCSGTLYLYQSSAIKVSTCRKIEEASGLATCAQQGTAYYNIDCSARYIVDTPSARITIQGTAFSVTFLPDRALTLVAVLEGRVTVQPVIDPGTDELGRSISVTEGRFLYTMPGEVSPGLVAQPARQALPVGELPPLVEELDIGPWMEQVAEQAKRDGVLHEDWPSGGEVEGPATGPQDAAVKPPLVTINLGMVGGPLDDERVRKAILLSFPKEDGILAAFGGEEVQFVATWREEVVDVRSVAYDPELAIALLKEAGYVSAFGALLVYPEGDEQLAATVKLLARHLARIGIDVQPEPMAEPDLTAMLRPLLEADAVQKTVLWLVRR